ncbi:MAG: FxsA family protein [Acidiferrobacterales bacterium]|nr:FxsA family protein [Acidiferrobacterales bacterium]
MRILFFLFLIVPVIEIYFLITVGSAIGAGLTVVLILLTAFIGAFLVRAQGFSTFARVQSQMARGEMPAIEIFEGVFLLVAGALLLTPGFLTDAIGFACLTPPLRRWLIRKMLAAGMLRGTTFRAGTTGVNNSGAGANRVIDAEYRDVGE